MDIGIQAAEIFVPLIKLEKLSSLIRGSFLAYP